MRSRSQLKEAQAPAREAPRAELAVFRAGITGSLRAFLSRYQLGSVDRLLLESGLDPDQLGNPEAMLSLRSWLSLLERIANETGDPCFGIEFAAQIPWSDLGVLGYVMLHSPTLATALENACRYFALQQTMGQMSFTRWPGGAHLSYALDCSGLGPANQHLEFVLFLIARFCRAVARDPAWAPTKVLFAHSAPRNCTRHQQLFGVPVQFGRLHNAVVLPSAALDAPNKAADPSLLHILRRHAEDCLSRHATSDSYVDRVRRLVTESLSSGDVGIEDIAVKLETSPRSLQRRLHEAGMTYQQLLEESRLALARKYLDDPSLTLTETAFLLGYSDLSAFSRAFRRWTGRSPLSFRRSRS